MAYVIRDKNGAITGVARWPADGVPDEILADDDPEILAFKQARADADAFDPALVVERLAAAAIAGTAPDLPPDQVVAINARRAARGETPV